MQKYTGKPHKILNINELNSSSQGQNIEET
jgi:hypothetical protein